MNIPLSYTYLRNKAYHCLLIFIGFFWVLSACQKENKPLLHPLPPSAVILAFGDSLTYGTGSGGEGYPARLERIIHFKVINAGIPGDETQNGLARIMGELEKYHPQLVILCLGGNDQLRKRPAGAIKENLRKIIQMIQSSGAQVVLLATPNADFSLSVPDYYAELGAEFNIPVDAETLPRLFKNQDYKSDYIHFNSAGYQAFAEAMANFLRAQGALNSQ